jgi:leucine dehydrogenase
MSVYFARMESQGFEELLLFHDRGTGLKAVVAIHNTALGPALGGTRMWPYPSEEAAVEDAMRLARGMTYKSAMAELDLGGGKGVILGDPCRDKSEALFRAYGRFVEKIGGRFITAVDMGINEKDLDWVKRETAHVIGGTLQGSPSPSTAFGVWRGMKAAANARFGTTSLTGLVIAVQGLGGVGGSLCRYLAEEGAALIVTDLDQEKVKFAVEKWGARPVTPEEIYSQPCDIYAPCGAGAVINRDTLPALKCRIVAGAANNVLNDEECGAALHAREILYAPDYVINAGGIIFVDYCRRGITDPETIKSVVGRIEGRLERLFRRAAEQNLRPETAACLMAEERLRGCGELA